MLIDFYELTLMLTFVSCIDYRFFTANDGSHSISIVEIAAFSVALLFLGRFAIDRAWNRVGLPLILKNSRFLFMYFFWAFIASIAGLLLHSSTSVFWYFRSLFPSVILFLSIVTVIDDIPKLKRLLKFYLMGISVSLLLGISQVLFDAPRIVDMSEGVADKLDFSGEKVSSVATGMFIHPNGLALLLLPVPILLVGALVYKKSSSVKRTLQILVFLSATLFVMASTFAKGTFVWTIFGISLLFIPRLTKKHKLGLCLTLLVLLISGIAYYSFSNYNSQGGSLGTVVTRIYLWVAALNVINNSSYVKFFGDGFDAMERASVTYANWEYKNAHNGILNQVLFFGLPALLFYLLMFLDVLKKVVGQIVETNHWLNWFVFASMIALFGEYFFEPANDGVVLQAQFFFFIAIATAISRPTFQYERG